MDLLFSLILKQNIGSWLLLRNESVSFLTRIFQVEVDGANVFIMLSRDAYYLQ